MGGPHRPLRENFPIRRPVGQFDALPIPAKIDGMLADNVAAPDGVDANLSTGSCADNALTPVDDLPVIQIVAIFEDFDELGGRPAGCIFLVVVVHFQDFRLIAVAQNRNGFTR